MKNKQVLWLVLGVILVLSVGGYLIYNNFIVAQSITGTSCSNDGSVRCYDRVNAQICTDWDGSGMKWGFCTMQEINDCLSSSNIQGCMSKCIDKKAFLTIGVAVKEFNFSPEPPSSIFNKQFACIYGTYYETSCSGNFINVRQNQCTYGCEGDKCKSPLPDECSSVGYVECSADKTKERTCLDGGDRNVWGQYQGCKSNEKCIEEIGCQENPNPSFDYKILIIILVIALLIFSIIFALYKYFIKKK